MFNGKREATEYLCISIIFKVLEIVGGGMEYKLFRTSSQMKSGLSLGCV